jgi:predicted RNase H-like HicB family nuclease
MKTPYRKSMKQTFNVLIERDSEGWLVASVPSLEGCHTQAKTFDELNERVQEAIEVCLEDGSKPTEFVGIQQVAVEV